MKNQMFLYSLLIGLSSFNTWAQQNAISYNEVNLNILDKNDKTIISKENTSGKRKIKHYHVEETVSLKFGGHKSFYNVTNSKLIATNDLGPNGKRTITIIYENGESVTDVILKQSTLVNTQNQSTTPFSNTPKINKSYPTYQVVEKKENLTTIKNEKKTPISSTQKSKELYPTDQIVANESLVNIKSQSKTSISDTPKIAKSYPISETVPKKETLVVINELPVTSTTDMPKKNETHIYIDILKTYERMSDKGYVSLDMLKKMGNSYFFNDEFDKAEKWYAKLFDLTTNLEPEYYYRYSIVLKSKGENKKSNALLKKFRHLSSVSSR
jgi:hypothetical protein